MADEPTNDTNSSEQSAQAAPENEGFERVLDFINLCRGVEGSLLANHEGLVVAHRLPDNNIPAETLAAWVTVLQESSRDCIDRMNQGDAEQVVVNTSRHMLLALPVWRFSLVVLARKGAALDFIQMRLGQAVSMMKTTIDKRYGALITAEES